MIDTNKPLYNVFTYPMEFKIDVLGICIMSEYNKGDSLTFYLIKKLIHLEGLNEILISISNAIDYIEKQMAQHMDLHGDNIIVDPQGTIKIIDYGSMIIPGSDILGNNINSITQIPDTHIGYGMYTLLIFLYDNPHINYLVPLQIKPTPTIYNTYLKTIIDNNGLCFSGRTYTNSAYSYSSIVSFSQAELKFLQQNETMKIKNYSGWKISQYLKNNFSLHNIINNTTI